MDMANDVISYSRSVDTLTPQQGLVQSPNREISDGNEEENVFLKELRTKITTALRIFLSNCKNEIFG